MVIPTIKDRINAYLEKDYDIEWINRHIIINSKVSVKDLMTIKWFLKYYEINYKDITIKGERKCMNYLGLWEAGSL